MSNPALSLGCSRLSSAYQHFYPQVLCTFFGEELINPNDMPLWRQFTLVKNRSKGQRPHE